nr:MAG TPA: hypothetical protein [Caudoviricetes sp.]
MWKQIFTATINILFLADKATIKGSVPIWTLPSF